MTLTAPFAGWCPLAEHAAAVAAPPYDVMSSAEARQRVQGKPLSFLHVSRPEVDLDPAIDVHADEVYAKAASNWQQLVRAGVLQQRQKPAYYVYRLQMGAHQQTGVVVAASVAAYDAGRIARHELTRPDKEDDRVRHIEALGAQTGPALLAWRNLPKVDTWIAQASNRPPDLCATGADGVIHSIWIVEDAQQVATLTAALDGAARLYIADGHHRSAAASRVAAKRRDQALAQRFLAVAFSARQMRILDYNRVVRDLNGLTPEAFLARVATEHRVTALAGRPELDQRGDVGLYLQGRWHLVQIDPRRVPDDAVGRLDVSLLHDHIIAPLLGITDPRRDQRIDFVGGIRGPAELERGVDAGEMAAAFALHPTSMEDLMAVADAGRMMPPKSTWFEPKLADGLVSYAIG